MSLLQVERRFSAAPKPLRTFWASAPEATHLSRTRVSALHRTRTFPANSLQRAVPVESRRVNPKNQLYYGDNLDVLRRYIQDESVDLIYLDPPFNSRQDYNVLFAERDGSRSSSQIMAFEDTWEWNLDVGEEEDPF